MKLLMTYKCEYVDSKHILKCLSFSFKANQLKFLSRSSRCIHVQRHGNSLLTTDDDDEEDADDDDRIETINLLMKFFLKLIKDVFIFPNNEFVIIRISKYKSFSNFVSKDSVDIIYNYKLRSKFFECLKYPRFFIVLRQQIMSNYLQQQL